VQVVQQAAPAFVHIEHDVDEAGDAAAVFGQDRRTESGLLLQAARPDGTPIGLDIAVEELIGVRAPVMAAPAVGMQPRHTVRIVRTGRAQRDGVSHARSRRAAPSVRSFDRS